MKHHEEAVKAFIEKCKAIAEDENGLDEKAGICIETARQTFQCLSDYEEEASAIAGASVIAYGAALEEIKKDWIPKSVGYEKTPPYRKAEEARSKANQANKRFLQARLFKLLAQSAYFALRAYEEDDSSLAQIANEANDEAERANNALERQRITEKDGTTAYEHAKETWQEAQAAKN